MAKKHRLLVIAVTIALMLDVLVACIPSALSHSTPIANEKFRSDLTSIYMSYDGNLADVDMSSRFALKRLMVTGYKGDACGAVATAVDENNGFAVLQFETEQQAENAYNTLTAKGCIVDADGIATLQSYDKGDMASAASSLMGVKPYINKCQMNTEEVIVAVIDTGIMLDHPEISPRLLSEGYDYSQDGFSNADYDRDLQPYYHHGTAVCGIIANNTMDNVKLLPYKVVPFGVSITTDSAVISAINNAVDMGASVINVSYASPTATGAYRAAVQNAYRNNVCICASAGNGSSSCEGIYPASITEAFAVGALNASLTEKASYSNYGEMLDFVAPGTKINTATPLENGGAGYDTYSGTSFSAPFVTAVCANVKGINPDITNDQLYDTLCDFCVDYGDEGFDEYYGNGVPAIGNISYSQQGKYDYSIPEGVLNVYSSDDYTAETQPWLIFAPVIRQVNVEGVENIGAYSFSNMKSAAFSLDTTIKTVGDYAFKGCELLDEISFDESVEYIGEGAFEDIEGLTISGYMNTPAYDYALANNIYFNKLGCKHAYIIDVNEPDGDNEGYTRYECRICEDYYIGEYLPSLVVDSGVCGDNLTYKVYSTGKLSIFGTGDMYDYSSTPAPWYSYAQTISIIQLDAGVTSVSPFAFYGIENLIEFRNNSPSFTTVNKSLYNANATRLICAVNSYGGIYTMPQTLTRLDATAFLAVKIAGITVNDNFTTDASLLYDLQGNIVMALPSYNSAMLNINGDINVNDYAFILVECPQIVRVYSTQTCFGSYSLGYHYDSGFVKDDLDYYGYVDAPAYGYVVDNDFSVNPLNAGGCGESLSWYYNVESKKLVISGEGDMTVYSRREFIPWYNYMSVIEEVVIGDSVNNVSPYSFYNAKALKKLTMPASLDRPSRSYTWSGTDGIEEINLTLGTGIMPNFGTTNSAKDYTYTPWYISRDSIQSFTLSPDVISIGNYAFKECSAIRSITLNNCSVISKYAFYDCSNLESFTIRAKDTSLASGSVLAYSSNETKNENAVLYAYDDSTAKDYAVKGAINFSSLGCGHSRGTTAVSDHSSCCYDATVDYLCKDCAASLYVQYLTAETNGHFVRATLKTTRDKVITDAEVYLDGELSAITNESGRFVIDGVKCDIDHSLIIKKHGYVIAETSVNTNHNNRNGAIVIKYGNFVPDTAVNGKDYIRARRAGFDDLDLIDFGKIKGERLSVNYAYANQAIPQVINMYIEQNALTSYRKDFYFETANTADYDITEVGVLYGKNMPDDFMVVENVGRKNAENLALKANVFPSTTRTYYIAYGASSSTGVLCTRLYIKYTNGVRNYIYYSDILSYEY